jgi:hypothetical protein
MGSIGQTILVPGNTSQDYYTPWFPRVADRAVFTYERIHATAPAIAVTVFHKEAEEAGDEGASAGSFSTSALGSTNLYEASCSDLRELVRFKITIASDSSAVGILHYRFLPPTWYTKAV